MPYPFYTTRDHLRPHEDTSERDRCEQRARIALAEERSQRQYQRRNRERRLGEWAWERAAACAIASCWSFSAPWRPRRRRRPGVASMRGSAAGAPRARLGGYAGPSRHRRSRRPERLVRLDGRECRRRLRRAAGPAPRGRGIAAQPGLGERAVAGPKPPALSTRTRWQYADGRGAPAPRPFALAPAARRAPPQAPGGGRRAAGSRATAPAWGDPPFCDRANVLPPPLRSRGTGIRGALPRSAAHVRHTRMAASAFRAYPRRQRGTARGPVPTDSAGTAFVATVLGAVTGTRPRGTAAG